MSNDEHFCTVPKLEFHQKPKKASDQEPKWSDLFPLGNFRGELRDACVIIADIDTAHVLQSKGSFGSTRSSAPRWVKRQKFDFHEANETKFDTIESKPIGGTGSFISTVNVFSIAQSNDQTGDVQLQLSFEDAFFLCFALGSLHVYRSPNDLEPMDIQEFWIYCLEKPGFFSRYIAYHYYRSRGWTVKSGLNYGVDFTLYRAGPEYYHSTFAVLVIPFDAAKDQVLPTKSWRALAGLTRSTLHVSKDLLFAEVAKTGEITDEELVNPRLCLPKFYVKEMLVRSWFPGKAFAEGTSTEGTSKHVE